MMKIKENKTGIWLDQTQAYLLFFGNGQVTQKIIPSDIDHSRIGGGARSKTPYGPMDTTSESKRLDRHLRQEKKYFESILENLKGTTELYLFGPAQTKDRLCDFLKAAHAFNGHILKVEAAHKMTENQRKAKVRDFFSGAVSL